MLRTVFVLVRLVYVGSSSLTPHLPPHCFVVTISRTSPFVLWDGVWWRGVGASESRPKSLRGPALVAPWILEVECSAVSLTLGRQLTWVAGVFSDALGPGSGQPLGDFI